MRKDRAVFVALLVYILVMLNIHSALVLALLGLLYSVSFFKIATKTIKAILFFNLTISIGYIIQSYINGDDFVSYLAVFNLRVFDITFMVFLFTSKINIIRVFSFNKGLRFILSATMFQIKNFQQTFDDFRLALKSRSVKKLNQRDKKSFIEAMFYYFFKKSLHNSYERTLALKSRGFFD